MSTAMPRSTQMTQVSRAGLAQSRKATGSEFRGLPTSAAGSKSLAQQVSLLKYLVINRCGDIGY